MAASVTRFEFLRGNLTEMRGPRRPPWALDGERFLEACEPCDKCRRACPERILFEGRDGTPELTFQRTGCTFCAKCAEACPTGALVLRDSETGEPRAPWSQTADIANHCLSLVGTTCRICGERCERGAITFKLVVGGIALPVVETAMCTGCGDCHAPCPVDAIQLR